MENLLTSAYYADRIRQHEDAIAELKLKYEAALAQEKEAAEAELNNTANAHALAACFDGIKNVYDANNPLTLAFPMRVFINAFYRYYDGLKSVVYVCFKEGIVTEENMKEHLEEWFDNILATDEPTE